MSKRNLFEEMMQGVSDMRAQREGKLTLRHTTLEKKPAPQITAEEIVNLRSRLHVSQPVFASYIRTSIETLRNWEQGKAKPNTQAALLIRLVEQHPDMIERLMAV